MAYNRKYYESGKVRKNEKSENEKLNIKEDIK